jgi:hypothetical protein
MEIWVLQLMVEITWKRNDGQQFTNSNNHLWPQFVKYFLKIMT